MIARTGLSGDLRAHAWQVSSVFIATGEKASYQGVTPAHAFDSKARTWGAIELKARYSQLVVDESVYPLFVNPSTVAKAAREWAAGLNWYFNRNVRFMADFDHTRLELMTGERKIEDVVLTRMQFWF